MLYLRIVTDTLISMPYFKMFLFLFLFIHVSFSPTTEVPIGSKIDEYQGVSIYYNGHDFKKVSGRNVTADGYNLGLRYQCVELVKRYYYERFHHKMPNAYGNAKDFFDKSLGDKGFNKKRGMMQYRNVREYQPKVDDLLVYDAYEGNSFGHVAIISEVTETDVEIVQQNMGLKTRLRIPLVHFYQYWTIADYNILGWLRME